MKSIIHIRYRFALILLCCLGFPASYAFCQEVEFTPSRTDAIDSFGKGDYVTALEHFRGLCGLFPADPLYKYYSGVCMVELKSEPDEAALLLKNATANSSALRPVPENAWFYLGRAYHLGGRFREAINAYDRYKEGAKRKEIKELRVDELIKQCEDGTGVAETGITPIIALEDEEEITLVEEPEIRQEEPVVSPDEQYNLVAREALGYQFMSDSLSRITERYRGTLGSLTGDDRESVVSKILELEELTFNYQLQADKKFAEATRLASIIFEGKGEMIDLTEMRREALRDDKISAPEKEMIVNHQTDPDSIIFITDTLVTSVTDSVSTDPEPPVILVIFDDDTSQPEKIPVNSELPEGLFYRIQTAAFRNPVDPSYFRKLGPVFGFKAGDSDITFYYIGLFRKLEDASSALVKVRNNGFKDAFVVAVAEGKRVSSERAEILEKEWGDISLTGEGFKSSIEPETQKPQEPPTLLYRVEVTKSKKKLTDQETEAIKMVAGNRKFDIYVTDDNQYVYLIGNFLTFESAMSYSDLLYRNGMKQSRIVAYLGRREIPLETAKQLFDLYFNK
ncbi:MAG TPA: hypothetical protein VMW76_02375 [Bacteroidales bacterium]|nr:hypothetical protein [Bacteroidales bacterium]